MEREGGGGIGMGNTCKPMAVSFQCMTKSTTNKKKKKEKEKTNRQIEQNRKAEIDTTYPQLIDRNARNSMGKRKYFQQMVLE